MSLVQITGTGNAVPRTHGVHRYLSTGRLPKGCGNIRAAAVSLREVAEQDALQRQNKLGTYEQALLSTIEDAEICRLLYRRWLRTKAEELPVKDQALLLQNMLRSGEVRNNALKELGLNRPPQPLDVAAIVEEVTRK